MRSGGWARGRLAGGAAAGAFPVCGRVVLRPPADRARHEDAADRPLQLRRARALAAGLRQQFADRLAVRVGGLVSLDGGRGVFREPLQQLIQRVSHVVILMAFGAVMQDGHVRKVSRRNPERDTRHELHCNPD
jgi:hypothetical protein